MSNPKEEDYYLCWVDRTDKGLLPAWEILYYHVVGWCEVDDRDRVLHWQPLPRPPQSNMHMIRLLKDNHGNTIACMPDGTPIPMQVGSVVEHSPAPHDKSKAWHLCTLFATAEHGPTIEHYPVTPPTHD